MRTPALVIGWAIWCQHRRALAGCAVALVVMALAYPFLFSITRSPTVVITSTIPFVVIYALVLNSLLVVEDPGSLTSSSPRHRFVFPVRTHTLVFWPMFYSWVVAALLWLATAGLIYRPSGFQYAAASAGAGDGRSHGVDSGCCMAAAPPILAPRHGDHHHPRHRGRSAALARICGIDFAHTRRRPARRF